uniref:G_PROTEIN_RECEP_F2_4 domain-containing protein n=1 Tax=Panagrellus redivivus TaxID=6233 RepID=A0A7E4ZSA5_PANRE
MQARWVWLCFLALSLFKYASSSSIVVKAFQNVRLSNNANINLRVAFIYDNTTFVLNACLKFHMPSYYLIDDVTLQTRQDSNQPVRMSCKYECVTTPLFENTVVDIFYCDVFGGCFELFKGATLVELEHDLKWLHSDNTHSDIPMCSSQNITMHGTNSTTVLCKDQILATDPASCFSLIPDSNDPTAATSLTTLRYSTSLSSKVTKTTQVEASQTTKPPETETTTIAKLPTTPSPGPDIDCTDPQAELFKIYCNITQGHYVPTAETVELVVNHTMHSYNATSNDNNAFYALSVIFSDCAKVINVPHSGFQAMSRLLDRAIDTDSDVFTATNTPMYSVSNRLSSGLFSMLVNAPPNATYLTGNNLALHVHALDCTQNDAGGISIGADDTFKLTHGQDELSSIAINAQSACSAGATRVHYTIYRNSKLFLGTSDNDTSNGVIAGNTYDSGLLGSTTESNGLENACDQGKLQTNGVVLAATALADNGKGSKNVKIIHQSDDTSRVMVKMRFKRSSIGVALHGKLKVTFWETDNRRWSSNTCNVKKDGKYYVSECTHLTDFTLIVDGTAKDPVLCSPALSIVNNVIVVASIVSLALLTGFYLIVFFVPNKAKRTALSHLIEFAPVNADKDPFLLIQVTLLLIFFFVFVLFSDGERLGSRHACVAVAVIEYFLLMANSTLAILQAWRTAKLFTESMRIERVLLTITKPLPMYLSVFLVPSLLTVLFWLVTSGDFFFRHDGFCWIRSDYIIPAVIIPMTFLICNAVACFGLFTKRMFPQFSTRIIRGQSSITINNKAKDAKERLARLFISQFTLGVPWVLQYFALFAPTTTAWHYLFAILNGSQGIVFLVAFIFRGVSVKRQQNSLWRRRHAARLASLEAARQQKVVNHITNNHSSDDWK